LVTIIVNPLDASALGPPPIHVGVWVNTFTQKVNAGGCVTYDVGLRADWRDFFNVTVGSTTTREQRTAQNLMVGPLPEGVEAIYPKSIYYINPSEYHSFSIEIRVSPDIEYSLINLTVLVKGQYRNETKYALDDFWLHVAPSNTTIGFVSTVLHDGFDREHVGGWDLMTDGGSVGLSVVSYVNRIPTHYLKLNDWWGSKSVSAERTIPRLNDSFIAEFLLRSGKINRFQFKFELKDSVTSEFISAELKNGDILVQNISYGPYEANRWYSFRFEADSDTPLMKWFLDDIFMDILQWRGSPDKIIVSTSDSGIGVGDVDEIFIQKKILISDTTITTCTSSKTSSTSETTKITLPGTYETLEEARKMVVNLKIKLPDPSILPEGFELRAVEVEPIGPLMPETFSGRMFRPERIHLYYSDKPFNESIMVSGYTNYLLITETYSLGSNSTRPYTEGQEIPPDVNVGWFYGYPGYMVGSIIHVYQFEEEMAYRLYSLSLTQDEILAVTKSLLKDQGAVIQVTPESQQVLTPGSTSFIVKVIPIEDFSGKIELHAETSKDIIVEFEPKRIDINPFQERQSILLVKVSSDVFPENSSFIVSAIYAQNKMVLSSNIVELNIISPLIRNITTTTTFSTTITSRTTTSFSTTITSTTTTTSIDEIIEPLIYYWAIASTILIVILAIFLILSKRR
jgi:hypothetical protein